MRTYRHRYIAKGIVCGFFVLVLVISFIHNCHYPVKVISGESSVGTWLSGVLLVTASVLSLVSGFRRGGFPWYIFSAFFALLALDERFMFHENLKQWIVFTFKTIPVSWHLLCDLPVILGACAGAFIWVLLWRKCQRNNRFLLLSVIILGLSSVIIDIFCLGAFWEDSIKLVAELLLVCALLGEIDM